MFRLHPFDRRLRALDDVNLDRRRFIHAQHLIRVEISLFDTTVLQRDLTVDRRGHTKNDAALDLRLNCIRIDPRAATSGRIAMDSRTVRLEPERRPAPRQQQ